MASAPTRTPFDSTKILEADLEACEHYVAYLEIHNRLALCDAVRGRNAGQMFRSIRQSSECHIAGSDEGGMSRGASAADEESRVLAPPLSSSFILHPIDSFVGVLSAYGVASLILGVAVLAAWGWAIHGERTAHPAVIAGPPAPLPTPEINGGGKVETVCVGKFTPLTNCTWRNSQNPASLAATGTVNLVSGTVELTYYTGVRVVIEGPAFYFARSPDMGYLRAGKLTVYRNQPSETRTRAPHPLVAVNHLHRPASRSVRHPHRRRRYFRFGRPMRTSPAGTPSSPCPATSPGDAVAQVSPEDALS